MRLGEDLDVGLEPLDFCPESLCLVPEPPTRLAELLTLTRQGRQLVAVSEEGLGPG